MKYLLLAFVLATALAFWYIRRKADAGYDIDVVAPLNRRNDLLYGYYGCETGQVDEVRGHVNLHWECQFHGIAQAAEDMLSMNLPTVLDVSSQLFVQVADQGKNFGLRPDAEAQLVAAFDYLRMRNCLHLVMGIVVLDEPNTNCRTPGELLAACQIVRRTSYRYTFELAGVKLVSIYATKPESFTCIEQFDWVGVDDYMEKSGILETSYQALLRAKRGDARTILLPGGAFGQDPTPFIRWAHVDKNVVAVVPFCWFGPREKADKWVGIKDRPELREQYVTIGKAIVGGGL